MCLPCQRDEEDAAGGAGSPSIIDLLRSGAVLITLPGLSPDGPGPSEGVSQLNNVDLDSWTVSCQGVTASSHQTETDRQTEGLRRDGEQLLLS